MAVYYNEFEPYCVEWLKNLIAAGHLPAGDVDGRDIKEVKPDDLRGYDQCHFFAGLGGWPLSLRLAGWPDDRPVWTGSCPCQPFSAAGKRKGFDDDRHLWPVWRNLIAECAPATVLGEQVASAADWLRLVRGDLEALGYAVGAIPVEAASAGAYHKRDRFWFVADANHAERRAEEPGRNFDNRAEAGRQQGYRDAPERGDGGLADALRDGAEPAAGDGHCTEEAPFGKHRRPSRAGAPARIHGVGGLADADLPRSGEGREQRGREQCRSGGDPETCDVGDAARIGRGEGRPEHELRSGRNAAAGASGPSLLVGVDQQGPQGRSVQPERAGERPAGPAGLGWVIGADGKARRVEPGIRLLAHGIPARVAKLRALGNAIDTRPAVAFIRAVVDSQKSLALFD